MYQTTYIGSHTCNAISEIVTNSTKDSSTWESYLLNSDHDSDVHDPLISSPTLTVKQEFPKESKTSSDLTDYKPFEPSLVSDLKDFEPFMPSIMP